MSQQLSTNTFVVSKFVVSADATQGTHTTIQAAITAASSGDVIWIREGTYTENLTLKFGVQLRGCGIGPVEIIGTMTVPTSGTGTCRFTDLLFTTNAANIIVSTGSNVAAATFRNCIFNITNATAISQANSGAASGYEFWECQFSLADGQAVFAGSGGNFFFFNSQSFPGGVGGSTANTISAGTLTVRDSRFVNPVTSSGTATVVMDHSVIDCNGANATAMTIGGSGNCRSDYCTYLSGSASALSVSATMNSYTDIVNSSNTNAVTGAGTFNYYSLTFSGSSSVINTTTKTGGLWKGVQTNTTPAAGFLGERISSTKGSGAAVGLSTGAAADMTSINLTAGIWDVSLEMAFTGGAITGTQTIAAVSTTSATIGTAGDDTFSSPTVPTVGSDCSLTVPVVRLSLTTTTTVYAVARSTFTVGTVSAYGRISGVRVG